MREQHVNEVLEKLFIESQDINISQDDRIVIFSDLHLGDGTSTDEYQHNSELFEYVLKHYYLERNYKLILNGDVEELYKFTYKEIYKRWENLYKIFNEFDMKNNLHRIIGNHDYELCLNGIQEFDSKIYDSLKLKYENNTIFIYHGHQTSDYFETYNKISLFFVKHFARPLRISNTTYHIDNKKKFVTEQRAYSFASEKKIVSILGHTHRPLFESFSKFDDLTFKIEKMIRKYPKIKDNIKPRFEKQLNNYKIELENLVQHESDFHLRNGIYNQNILVPSLFNSGCVIGKRGLTGIEIKKGKIYLVYWFDRNNSQRYLDYDGIKSKQLNETNYYKAILKNENLDYIFSRIKLLT